MTCILFGRPVCVEFFRDTARMHIEFESQLPEQHSAARRPGSEDNLRGFQTLVRSASENGKSDLTTTRSLFSKVFIASIQRNMALMLPQVRFAVVLVCDTVTGSVSGAGFWPLMIRILY